MCGTVEGSKQSNFRLTLALSTFMLVHGADLFLPWVPRDPPSRVENSVA
jgi:hypothetical protein